jgi:hypothetical protein
MRLLFLEKRNYSPEILRGKIAQTTEGRAAMNVIRKLLAEEIYGKDLILSSSNLCHL